MPSYSISLDQALRLHLTRREQAVLLQLAQGRTTQQVASELGIRPGTVRSHISSLGDKLESAGRAHLLIRAIEEGVLTKSDSATQ